MYYIYKIIEPTSGDVVYVGQTKRLKLRIAEHTKYDYPSRPAKFINHTVEVITTCETKEESLQLEFEYKQHYSLKSEERCNRTWIRKMDYEMAQEMRRLYATGDYTYQMLINMFPVNSSNSIYRILKNLTYTS